MFKTIFLEDTEKVQCGWNKVEVTGLGEQGGENMLGKFGGHQTSCGLKLPQDKGLLSPRKDLGFHIKTMTCFKQGTEMINEKKGIKMKETDHQLIMNVNIPLGSGVKDLCYLTPWSPRWDCSKSGWIRVNNSWVYVYMHLHCQLNSAWDSPTRMVPRMC